MCSLIFTLILGLNTSLVFANVSVAPLGPCDEKNQTILPSRPNGLYTRFMSKLRSTLSPKKSPVLLSKMGCSPLEINTQASDFGAGDSIPPKIKTFLQSYFSKGSGCLGREVYHDMLAFHEAAFKLGWEFQPQELYNLFYHIQTYRKDWLQAVLKDPSNKKLQVKYIPLKDPHAAILSDAMIHVLADGKIIIAYGGKILGEGASKKVFSVLASDAGSLSKLSGMAKPEEKEGEGDLEKEIKIFRHLEKHRTETEQVRLIGIAETRIIALEREKEGFVQKQYASDLASWLETHPDLSLNSFKKIAKNAATGLRTLHELGYVHGDVKAENILLNNPESTVLTDFGLTYNPKTSISNRTTYTVEAPEALTQKPLSRTEDPAKIAALKKRDVYGLGILLSEIYLGKHKARKISQCRSYLDLSYPTMVALDYSRCIEKISINFHKQLLKEAATYCYRNGNSECIYKILADCVHPDPEKRISSDELIQQLDGW